MIVIEQGFTGAAYPFPNPRIGWRRATGTITASTAAAGYAAANAAAPETFTFWRPTVMPATWALEADEATEFSYLGIAAHTLGTDGATVTLEVYDPGLAAWQAVAAHTPADDAPILFLFAPRYADKVRLSLAGATAPTIGVIYAGAVTEFPRRATYAPSVSLENTKHAAYSVNLTDGGQWAGRSLIYRAFAPEVDIQHIPEDWSRTELEPFALAAEAAPFFIADRPGEARTGEAVRLGFEAGVYTALPANAHDASVAYAWAMDDIRPARAAPNAGQACNLQLKLTGFKHGT
jgi:hypothetical protein